MEVPVARKLVRASLSGAFWRSHCEGTCTPAFSPCCSVPGSNKLVRSAWSFRWLMKLWAFGLVTASCALDARSTAVDCISCVETRGSWQLGSCHTEDMGDCPIADADCCTNAECCVTSGCRSPEDTLVENPFAHPVSCHR